MTEASDHAGLVELFEALAVEAGAAIMKVRAAGISVDTKGDDSPVTQADRAAEAIILKGLKEQLPDIPVVAEEAMAAGRQPDITGGRFILVDPLDGTREFIKGTGDFTVNIALIEGGEPVAGTVYAPMRGQMWSGSEGRAFMAPVSDDGAVGDRRPISCSDLGEPLRVVASSSHRTAETNEFIARFPGAETVSVGSSLKFCLVAEGGADIYPRFGRTMEWDTAAGDAVLRAAGGTVSKPDGSPFSYGKLNQAEDSDFANGWFVAATGAARGALDLKA